jgi:hypothetical protein
MNSLTSLRYRRVLWGTAIAACLLSGFVVMLTKVPAHVLKRGPVSRADQLSRSAAVVHGSPASSAGVSLKSVPALDSSASSRTPQAAQPRLAEAYGKLPLSFEVNKGQTDSRVKFLSRGRGYSLFLTGNEAVLSLNKSGVRSQ